MGDFNINFYNPSHPLFSNLCNILDYFSLSQVVSEPTHTSPQGNASLIDLALISDASKLISCSVVPPLGTSDHNGMQLSLKWRSTNHMKAAKRKIWQYGLADFETANSLQEATDFAALIDCDIDQAWSSWKYDFFYLWWSSVYHTKWYRRSATYLGLMQKETRIPFLRNCNGDIISDDEEKAAILNNFLSQCFNTSIPVLWDDDMSTFVDNDADEHNMLNCCIQRKKFLRYAAKSWYISLVKPPEQGQSGISATLLKATAESIAKGPGNHSTVQQIHWIR